MVKKHLFHVYLPSMKIFNPPIATRTSKELVKIVAIPENWDEEAVAQAQTELLARGVDYQSQVEREKFLHERRENMERIKREKESYSIGDFIFEPFPTLLEILISWELKKDGYLRKARQQKIFRAIILGIAIIIYLYTFINGL